MSTGVRRTSAQEMGVASQEDVASEDRDSGGRMSPYLMISKTGDIAKVTEFESPGLLYAKPTSKSNDRWVEYSLCGHEKLMYSTRIRTYVQESSQAS